MEESLEEAKKTKRRMKRLVGTTSNLTQHHSSVAMEAAGTSLRRSDDLSARCTKKDSGLRTSFRSIILSFAELEKIDVRVSASNSGSLWMTADFQASATAGGISLSRDSASMNLARSEGLSSPNLGAIAAKMSLNTLGGI